MTLLIPSLKNEKPQALLLPLPDAPRDEVDDCDKFTGEDLIPCNWTITAVEGKDQIHAINIKTQTEFEGAIANFNMLLKG